MASPHIPLPYPRNIIDLPPSDAAGAACFLKGSNVMGKLYTLDDKLLIGSPEIRIGDKVYPVDDRIKTVKKMEGLKDDTEILKLAFGVKAAKEIDDMNLPYSAYAQLVRLVASAMTGEEVAETRFPDPESK